MSRRSHSEQFDLFHAPTSDASAGAGEASGPAPRREGGERASEPSADAEHAPATEDVPYHPTDAEEQERVVMEHGPDATYRPPRSRAQRMATRRRIREIMDDIRGRMGAPGRQLIMDAGSPFVAGAREAAEERRRADATEAERRERGDGKRG